MGPTPGGRRSHRLSVAAWASVLPLPLGDSPKTSRADAPGPRQAGPSLEGTHLAMLPATTVTSAHISDARGRLVSEIESVEGLAFVGEGPPADAIGASDRERCTPVRPGSIRRVAMRVVSAERMDEDHLHRPLFTRQSPPGTIPLTYPVIATGPVVGRHPPGRWRLSAVVGEPPLGNCR